MVTSSPVTNTSAVNSTAPVNTATAPVSAEQNQFMTLLVAQMRNQDPLNPMDNNQMSSQMALLNMVSGINSLNKTLSSMSASQQLGDSFKATDLIGHTVLIPNSSVVLNNGNGDFSIDLADNVQSATVSLTDKQGNLIKSFNLGATPAGVHSLSWNGLSDDGQVLADGSYTIKIDALKNGTAVNAASLVTDRVDNLVLSGGLASLQLSRLGNIGLSDIRAVY